MFEQDIFNAKIYLHIWKHTIFKVNHNYNILHLWGKYFDVLQFQFRTVF